jgi:hypothetical protein
MATDDQIPNLDGLADRLIEGLFDPAKLTRLQNAIRNAASEAATISQGVTFSTVDFVLEKFGAFLASLETHIEEIAGPPLAGVVGHLLGDDVSVTELRQSAAAGGDPRIGRLVAQLALKTLSSDASELTPGTAGAERFLTLVSQLVVNGWFEGTAFALLAEEFPFAEALESLAELPRELVDALGLGRLARVALRPLAQTLIATPLTWELNKKHTPSRLSDSQLVQLFLRNAIDESTFNNELSQQGWSPARVEFLKLLAAKYVGVDDALVLGRHQVVDRQYAVQALENQGWDPDTAEKVVQAAELRRQDAIADNALPTLLRAYVNNDLSESQFQSFLPHIIPDGNERSLYEVAASLQHDYTISHLTHSEVIECVELEILPTSFYRAWLTRQNYPLEEAFALELRLRARIDKATTIEQHRAAIEAERAAEKARADAEKAARIAQAEADRALARRGSLTELRRAAVRGLVPLARVEEILQPQYDADFIATYMNLVEQDRVEYVRQQDARAAAEQRALNKHIDVGALEQAVLTNVLDFDRFRSALRDRGIVDADADILTATLRARKADLDAARQQRAAAEAALRNKHIDLGRFETLVRRGHRTLAEYDQLLTSIGFSEPARAAMADLLQLQIADDARAARAKDDAAAALRNKGVSLETERRAVILELVSVDDYSRFLFGQGFNADAVALMIADVQHAIDDARAARARRDQPPPPTPPRAIPLADVRRAARTGVIFPDTYRARLEADGYTADDIAIEMDLLLQEIADVQAARLREMQADQAAPAGLSLAQLAAAVRAGVKHLEDYRAAAAANPNLTREDVATLVRVLADELAGSDVARARRTAIASTVKPQDVSIGALEARVRAGTLAMQDYVSLLEGAGLDEVDIDLLTTLLLDELTATPPA